MQITVVVINYNYGRFLRAAIQSVLDQTWKACQIVVVDDGSTDDSLDLLKIFSTQVQIIPQANKGHVRAFEVGFKSATGQGVLFLDADDFLYAGALQAVADVWNSDDISKVQFRLDTVDKDGSNQDMTFPHFPDGLTPESLKQQALALGTYPWTVSSGNVYASEYLRKVLPIDISRFPRSPDGYVNKLAPLYGRVISLRQVLGAYRVHGANVWAQGHGGLNAGLINRTVALDLSLDEEFRLRAHRLGIDLRRKALETPQHLEYRLLGLILQPAGRPVIGDSRLRLAAAALRSLRRNEALNTRTRLIWSVWFVSFALMPAALAARAYQALRSQTGRAPVAKSLLRFSRRARAVTRADNPGLRGKGLKRLLSIVPQRSSDTRGDLRR